MAGIGKCRQCAFPFYDFLHVKAAVPYAALSCGFDYENYVSGPAPEDVHTTSGPDVKRWPTPGELVDTNWQGLTFYRRRVTIEVFKGYIGSTDLAGNFNGALVTKTRTTIQQAYPYYQNNWDLAQVPADADPFNVDPSGAVNQTLVSDPQKLQDLRLTSFPASGDISTTTHFASSDGSSFAAFAIRPTSYGPTIYDPTQAVSPAPVVTRTSYTMQWDVNIAPPAPGGSNDLVDFFSTTYLLEDPVTWNEFMAQIDGLLSLVALWPKTLLVTREGPLYVDYFGVSNTYPEMNLIPSGAVYAWDGTYILSTLNANQMYGMTWGANEADFYTALVPSLTLMSGTVPGVEAAFQRFPYYWYPGAITVESLAYNEVRAPQWKDTSSFPITTTFVSKTGSVRIHGGTPGAPVTAVISPAHGNCLCIFPLRSGHVIANMGDDWLRPGMISMHVACDSPNFYDGSYLTGWTKEKTLIRVPRTPPAGDPTFFGDLDTTFPGMNLLCLRYTFGPLDNRVLEQTNLDRAGEYIFTPDMVQGIGYIYFGATDQITAATQTGAGNAQAAGDSTQSAGLGTDAGL